MKSKKAKWLFGIGLDDSKGHKRVTKGENFYLVGGSKETHEQMTEHAIKLNESLKKIGKDLNSASKKELVEIAHKLGLNPIKKK